MSKYSIIIPVYNHLEEIQEMLESLIIQDLKDLEILIVEDGSTDKCENIVQKFTKKLNIKYYFKENTGQVIVEILIWKRYLANTLYSLIQTVYYLQNTSLRSVVLFFMEILICIHINSNKTPN